MMVLFVAPFLYSCGSTYEEEVEVPPSIDDSMRIDQFHINLRAMYDAKKAGNSAAQATCQFEKGEEEALILRWDEVADIFDPVNNEMSAIKYIWYADDYHIARALQNEEYSVELSDNIGKVIKGKYVLILETKSRTEPQKDFDEFISGVYTGVLHVFDIKTQQLQCSVPIRAENTPMVSYNSTDSPADINRKLQRDLDEGIQFRVKEARKKLFQ